MYPWKIKLHYKKWNIIPSLRFCLQKKFPGIIVNSLVSISPYGHAWWTIKWIQYFPLLYVIAEVSFGFWVFIKQFRWLVRCIREDCPIPMDTLLRRRNGTRPAVFRMATCGVTGTGRLYRGHALTQSLSDCLCKILKHFQATCNQYQNCAQPFVGGRHPPLPTLCVSLHPVLLQHHRLLAKWD